MKNVISDKETTINWCFHNKLLANKRKCPVCNCDMKYTLSTTYSSDGVKWRCQKLDHTKDVSIRRNSWFEGSNMTLEEVIELTYWWSTGMKILMRFKTFFILNILKKTLTYSVFFILPLF